MYQVAPGKSKSGRYFAGLLYVINPFVFVRLQAGHLGLLLAYAVTPWIIDLMFSFFKDPDIRKAIKLGIWITVALFFSIHSVYIILVLIVGLLVYARYSLQKKGYLVKALKMLLVVFLVLLVFNSFWLVPAVFSDSQITQIDARHIDTFMTRSDPFFGLFINVAAMYGFWQTQMFNAKSIIPGWIVIFFIVYLLWIIGLLVSLKRMEQRPRVVIVKVIAAISIVLAVGVASPVTEGIYRVFFYHVGFFSGFPEPNNFVSLLVFSYCYLGSLCVDAIDGRLAKQLSKS